MSFTQFTTLILLFQLIFSLDYSDQKGTTWPNVCQSGTIQSPINIQTSNVVDDKSVFSFKSIDYSTIASTSVTYQHEYSVSTPTLDNGNIKVKINGTEFTYKIANIHFHLNSEHTIDGNLYDMEMHVVHENTNSDDKNNLHMVIGYIFEAKENYDDNDFLNSIGFNTGDTVSKVKVKDIVKKEKVYYYKGSLTTPPCTEDVNWVVVKNIKKMSTTQFNKFKEYVIKLNSAYARGNNRQTYSLNERKVYLSNDIYIKFSFPLLLLFFILF
jgi:carbonic anhydrase